jgi:threonine/homoserine/homoserine lactone efflux protein
LADVAAHPGSSWLIAGASLSIFAALAHLACIVGGPEWYRFFGAGEAMARAAGRGEWMPTLVTLGIAAMLLVWGAYALSGAGLLPRLPLLRTGLAVIAAIYICCARSPLSRSTS